MRHCSLCGFQNLDTVQSCLNCAAVLEAFCPQCRRPAAGGRFCGHCGAALQPAILHAKQPAAQAVAALPAHTPAAVAEKIKTASVRPAGEARDVTILAAQLANLAPTAHHLNPETLYLFIDEAVALLAEIVVRYEGTVDKFTGSGLLAFFGAPIAHENDPERAVLAALDMQAAIQPLQQRFLQTAAKNVPLCLVVHTGPVIAGRIGNNHHMEYTVSGQTVEQAMQLAAAIQPGVVVSAPTYRLTRAQFEFSSLPPATFNPPAPSLDLFEARRRQPQSQNLPIPPPPMVGRGQELARLHQVMAAVAQGQRRLALVCGEAGIGKSTLITQFCHKTGLAQSAVFSVTCHSYTRTAPLWAVGRLLQQALGLISDPSANPETTLNRLAQLNLPAVEIWPYVATILGQPKTEIELTAGLSDQDADMLQRQIHSALRRVWLAVARLAPTAFIVEDGQWLDPASAEFFKYLIQTTTTESFLLIAATRRIDDLPGAFQLLAADAAGDEDWLQVMLKPLPTSQIHQLVDQIITHSSPDFDPIKQKITERSGGNPLFTKEITRMLIEQGGLTRAPNQVWLLSPQANNLLQTVPTSLKGLILARFDRLPADVRRTLQTAAAAGNAFPRGLIYGSTGNRAETVVTHLQILERNGFLQAHPFYGQAGYIFQHTLLRDAVYSTLLKRDRQALHIRLAQTINQSNDWPPEEKITVLAHHYAESSQPEQAIPYLTTAANLAAQHCAYHTAIEQYRRAINLTPPQENPITAEYFEIRVGLGRSLKFVGELIPAGELFTEIWQKFPPLEPPVQTDPLWQLRLETLRQLADVRQREGLYDEALQHLETGLNLLGQAAPTENPHLWRLLVERQAWINFRQGRLPQAFNLAQSAMQGLNATQLDHAAMLARLYNTLGGIVWQQGNPDQAIDYVEHSLELYKTLAYDWGIANAYGNLGILHDVTGQWAKAEIYHRQTLEMRLQMGDAQHQATALDNLSILHMNMGQFEAARREMEAGLQIRQKLGDRFGLAHSQCSLAELNLLEGAYQTAQTYAQSAMEMAQAMETPEIEVYAGWILARVQANLGQPEAALALANTALAQAKTAGLAFEEIDCLRTVAILQQQASQTAEARQLLEKSAALAQKQNDPYRHGLALLELGRIGNPGALTQAIEIFQTLGAAYDLQQAQAWLKANQ